MMKLAFASLALGLAAAIAYPALADQTVPLGAACHESADCEPGASCFQTNDGRSICMQQCVEGDRVCADDTACLPSATSEKHVCYSGGTVPLGDACNGNTECDHGVCVEWQGQPRCYAPCHLDDPLVCPSGELCAPVEGDPVAGFCRPSE